jgi:DNA-binding response OmpR family regulator
MTQQPTAIIAQSDATAAAQLAEVLRQHCRSVLIAKNADDLRYGVPRHRAELVIADLELLDLQKVRELHNEFGGVHIVCTHRVADEELWAQSLAAGADDCCYTGDTEAILRAAFGRELARRKAAA